MSQAETNPYPRYDAHIHMGLGQPKRARFSDVEADIRATFARCRDRGIRALRDGGDRLGYSVVARRFAADYGIDYRTPLYALYKRGHYGALIGQAIDGGKSFRASFDRAFDALLSRKPDHLKIALTGTVPLDPAQSIGDMAFDRDELSHVMERANEAGLPVMVHANGEAAVCLAAALGAQSIEHGYRAGQAGLEAMAAYGCVWVPTIAPFGNLLRLNPPALAHRMPEIERIAREQIEQLATALSMGVIVAIGSDAGARGVPHAEGCFDERSLFLEAGLTVETLERVAARGYDALFAE